MARTVYVPEAGGALNFADGTTDQQIIDYVRSKYAPAPVAPVEEAGIGALEAGLYGFRSRSQAAFGKAAQWAGLDDTASFLFDKSRENEKLADSYKPDVADVTDIRGPGDLAKFAGSTIGQSATESGVGIAGAYAGAAAGAEIGTAVLPGYGTVAGGFLGGIIGGAIAALPGFIGGNLQRQVSEKGTTLEDASGYDASVAAFAQAPLDAAFDALIARKLPGGKAALDVARKSFFKEIAKTAATGALTESLTEPAQQAIEIAQANPEKLAEFGPDVQRELLNAAAGGALAGGIIGGAGGGIDTIANTGKPDTVQKDLASGYVDAGMRGEQMKKFAETNAGVEKLAAQNSIGSLRLGKVRIDPTPDNGLSAPLERFQILDTKGNAIAEFSNPVNAADAVSNYSRMTGKKITLQNMETGAEVPTASNFPQTKPVLRPEEPKPPAPKPPKLSAAAKSAIKNADIATRIAPIETAEIPYDSLTWNQTKKAPEPVSGKSKIVDYGGRKMVVASVNGVNVPFYLSSSAAGKAKVPAGKWYPFFGIGSDGWINKTSQEEIANYYGDEDLRRVAETLDNTVGDIRQDNTIPRVGASGAHMSFINSGLDPSENETPETLDKVTRNIKSVIEKVRANKPVAVGADPAVTTAPDVGAPEVADVEEAAPETSPEVAAEAAPEAAPEGIAALPAPEAAVEEQAAIPEPPAPTNHGFDTEAAAPIVNEAEQEAVRAQIADRKLKIVEGVQDALKRYNLKDVQTKFVPAFTDAIGNVRPIEGSESMVNGESIVTLSTDIYDPSLSVEQMVNKVIDVLNHESIHSLFDLGLIRPAEKAVLMNAVATAKVPGRQYTYLDMAKKVYDPSKPGMEVYANPDVVAEEAIAEMFRDWRKNNKGAPPNTRGLFNRIIDALRHMFNVMRRNRYEDIFTDIETGKVGLRERSANKEQTSKYSTLPSGYKVDNPGGEWLKGKQESAILSSRKYPRGSAGKMLSGSVTAYAGHSKPLMLPVSELIKVKGVNNENRVPGDYQFDELQKAVAENGYTNENPVMVFVNHLGQAYINEGNTRIAVANASGVPRIAAWVHWFNGGENAKGEWTPERVAQMEREGGEAEKFSMAPELPKLSVAPAYPYGQNVPGVNAAQINNTLDHITYGAGVDMLNRVFNSRVASSVIPDKFRPSKAGLTNFMQKFADRMLPVGQMVDFIKANGGTVPDAFDAYMAEELMHGRVADSLESREVDMYTPLMEYIKNSGLSQAEVEDFLYARHAKERNARMRELNPGADPAVGSGMTDEEADAILRAVDNSSKREQILNAERMFRAIIDDTNALRVEAGLTPDFGNMVDEAGNPIDVPQYQYYAPLRGFADESITEGEVEDELRARIGRGFKIRGREDMRAFGRTSKASDIIAHAMLQNTEAVIRAAKNRVGQSFLNLVEANPDLAEQYGVEVLTKGKKPLKKYISSKGVVKTMVDPMYKNSDDVMVVKRNGEEIPIRIDNPFLQKALLAKKSGSPDIAERAINVMQKLNRFMAAMNTAYNPEFMLVNFPRDLQTAMVNITQYEIDGIQKKVLKDALPAVKGVYEMLRNPGTENEWTQWYNMFKQDGGKTSGFFGTFTLDERLKKLEKISQDVSGQPSHRLKEAFDGIKGWLEDANGAFENAVRLSVYKNLVEAGLTRERAAQAAKNLTVNFDKRGEYGPILNSLYLFYNASVQGTLSMMMAASRSRKVRKVIGGIVVVGLLQDMINSLMSDKDDDGKNIYDKIPDYKLQTNMILMDPFGLTKNGYYAIPLPYGFNAFYNMGRSISRNMRGEYKTSQAVTSMMSTFVDAFNPVGGTESFLNFIAPTVLDPVVALSINQDFTGRKIYPEPFPGSVPKADSQMYWSTTSPLFRNTADFMNWATGGTEYVPGMIDISPDVMEYMFDYALGGVGSFARRVYDTGTSTIPAAVSGDLADLEINNIPLLRKLYGNVSTRVSMEDYFDKVNHVLARGEELKSAMKEGDPQRIKSVRARFADEIAIYPTVKSLANRRNKLASELRKVRENTKMPPEQKRRRQDVLQKQIETITNRVNKLYEDKLGNKYPSLFS